MAKTALVVDDTAVVLDLFKALLEEPDLQVHAVTDVSAAIKVFDALDVAVVVTDHEMPRRTGLDLVAHIGGRCPVVVVTAYRVADRYVAAGVPAEHVLPKPFNVFELRTLVRRLAGLPGVPALPPRSERRVP